MRARPAVRIVLALMAATTMALAGCGGDDARRIRVATSPGPYSELFREGVGPVLEGEGWDLEYVNFTELQQADVALSEGSVDLNVDQHTAYMDVFNESKGADLAPITPVPTVPAGLFSQRHDSLDAVAEGQKVGIPQDPSNLSRAYNILAKAGWITLTEDADPVRLTERDVAENPHRLEIIPMDSATLPRSLPDLGWAVIPGSISYSSGVDTSLQLLQEDLRPSLILVAVTRADQVDAQWAGAVKDAYRSKEFHDHLAAENEDDYWFVPEEIRPGAGE